VHLTGPYYASISRWTARRMQNVKLRYVKSQDILYLV